MVVEINSAGLRKPIGETYPSKELLEMVYELDIPISFSCDAHSVEQVGFGYDNASQLAKDIGLTKASIFENRDRITIKLKEKKYV
jgi:histidinol-phosphatase (PHP family)